MRSLAMAGALADLPDDLKAPWIGTLAGRGDSATLPVLVAAATDEDGPVRLAAVQALPRFGAVAMPGLLRLLEDHDPDVAQACRDALAALPRPEAHTAAADLLQSPDATARVVAVTLIRQLQLAAFAEDLAAALGDPERAVRLEAARALRELAGTPHIAALRTALLDAADPGEAQALEHALTATAVRAGDPDTVAGQLIGTDLHAAKPARHAAILHILGQIGGARALEAVLAGTGGSAGEVRTAAVDVLCNWPDPAAAPELLRIAQNPATPTEQLACLRGAIRLAGNESLPGQQRLDLLDQAKELIQRDEEKHLWLSALAGIGSSDALNRAMPLLDTPATREEACAAILAIAELLATTPDAAECHNALESVAQITTNPDFAKHARELLRQ
jgi:HEAT repeat protein